MDTHEMFEEIKNSCKEKRSDLTSVIDDIHGARNISEHFKNIYEKLFADPLKAAVKNLKVDKSGDFTSDGLKESPDRMVTSPPLRTTGVLLYLPCF